MLRRYKNYWYFINWLVEFLPSKFYYFLIGKHILLITAKLEIFLTCLTTYLQTYVTQLYKHRNLKGSEIRSVVLGSQNISDCIECKSRESRSQICPTSNMNIKIFKQVVLCLFFDTTAQIKHWLIKHLLSIHLSYWCI